MQNFSERLEAAWRASDLKKGDIARELGVALSTVSRWFSGTVPDAQNLHSLAELLGVSAEFLTRGLNSHAKYSPELSQAGRLEEERKSYESGQGITEDDLYHLLHMLIIRMENEVNPSPEDLATARRTLETIRRMRESRKHDQN